MTEDPSEPVDETPTHKPCSSSPRGIGDCDALLKRDNRVIGSMRLPEIGAEEFIEHFNHTYREIGLHLEPIGNG